MVLNCPANHYIQKVYNFGFLYNIDFKREDWSHSNYECDAINGNGLQQRRLEESKQQSSDQIGSVTDMGQMMDIDFEQTSFDDNLDIDQGDLGTLDDYNQLVTNQDSQTDQNGEDTEIEDQSNQETDDEPNNSS